MLKNTDKVRVENRSGAIVVYRIPESNYVRRFMGKETKEIAMSELRAAIQVPGTRALIMDDLIIHSKEAVEELLPEAEPEYFYNTTDVEFLLTRGSLDQLRDALDFAPEGVVALIKDQAVNIELNDVQKREIIKENTGFDVTKAIEIKHISQTKTETETKSRRASVPVQGDTEIPQAPARRTEAPKYKVVK